VPMSDGLGAVLKLFGFLALATELLLPCVLLLLLLKKAPVEKVGTKVLDGCCCSCCCCCPARG